MAEIHNYVKFQRGSQAAYDKLKAANRLEDNALYFIQDPNNLEKNGALYLGKTLISGINDTLENLTLSSLNDLNITDDLTDGYILQYDITEGKWVSTSLITALENVNVSPNASSIIIKDTQLQENETLNECLTRVNNSPTSGDISFVDGVPYLYDGEQWKLLVGESIDNRVTLLENEIITIKRNVNDLQDGLEAVDGKIARAIESVNQRQYEITQTLPNIEDVGELNNTIFLVPNDDGSENNSYTEYIAINGQYEKIGSSDINLNNYVTTENFNNTVSDLTTQLNNLSTNLENVSDNYVTIENFENTVNDLTTQLNDLSADLLENVSDNYVTIERYTTEVGELSKLLTATGKQSTTVIDEIISLQEELTWAELDEDEDGSSEEDNG